jgi:hypothetical protein
MKVFAKNVSKERGNAHGSLKILVVLQKKFIVRESFWENIKGFVIYADSKKSVFEKKKFRQNIKKFQNFVFSRKWKRHVFQPWLVTSPSRIILIRIKLNVVSSLRLKILIFNIYQSIEELWKWSLHQLPSSPGRSSPAAPHLS